MTTGDGKADAVAMALGDAGEVALPAAGAPGQRRHAVAARQRGRREGQPARPLTRRI